MFLYRELRGKPTGDYYAYKKVNFESCGKETVSVEKPGSILAIQSTEQFIEIPQIKFEDLKDIFKSSSKNCPIIVLGVADTTASEFQFVPYPNNTFSVDDKNNLRFDVSKPGKFKGKLTPLLHSNFAYLDLELEVIEPPIPKINKPPKFKTKVSDTVFDFTQNQKILRKLNDPEEDQSLDLVLRVQLPDISDPDSGSEHYKVLKIEDLMRVTSKSKKRLGSIVNRGAAKNELFHKKQYMNYEIAGRFIVIKLKSTEELLSVDGVHLIQVTLSDYEKDKSVYNFNIVFKVPPKRAKLEQKKMEISDNENVVAAKIDSINEMGQMNITFSRMMHTQFNLTDLNQSNVDIWLAPANDWHLELEGGFDIRKFNFTWNVTSFNLTTMAIQLTFNNPPQISQTSVFDSIVVNFLDQETVVSMRQYPLA